MKYYLVNFLVCHGNTIMENNTVALSVDMNVYDCTTAFRTQLLAQTVHTPDNCDIVIKTYKQISEDIFLLVHPFVKKNPVIREKKSSGLYVSYRFHATNYSR